MSQQELTHRELSTAKRALLEQRLRGRGTRAQPEAIAPRTGAGPAPLSFAQQRLWFLDQLMPGSTSYHMLEALRLEGELSVPALQQAIDGLIARHESLRTSFASVDGEPAQVIAPALALPLEQHAAASEEEARAVALGLTSRPFDLASGPLLRAALVQIAPQLHVLVLVLHHIIADGWSVTLLLNELAALYAAAAQGRPAPLAPPALQYADYAAWQRGWLDAERMAAQLGFWRGQLAGAPPLLTLPTDRPRPPMQRFHGAATDFVIPPAVGDALHALTRAEGATPFMTMLAAFGLLLARHSGQTDVCIGSPVAGRQRAELEGIVGLFLNTLVFRVRLGENPSFRELLRQVRSTALDGYGNQDVPFEKLVEELKPERNLSYSPLYQAMLIFMNTPEATLDMPGLKASFVGVDVGSTKSDLSAYFYDGDHGFGGTLVYNTDLFDAATVESLKGRFLTLLADIAAHPDRRIADLALVRPAEREQLLHAWQGDTVQPPQAQGFHQLVEAQAARTPDAVAITYGAQQLTYRELNERANQLAHALTRFGVGPEVPVGVCLERSPELPIALLAVLKAGGAYVPLDPSYPTVRLAFMLDQTKAPLLLTRDELRARFPGFAGEVLALESGGAQFASLPRENLPARTIPDQLAYIVFTSGSTGQPKGVMSLHRGVINYLGFLARAYGLSAADTVLQVASSSFDASVRDMIGPLTVGARVVLVPSDAAREPAELLRVLRDERVSCVLSVVPTMLRALAEVGEGGAHLDALRLMLVSGERLPLEDGARARRVFGPGLQVVNQYGPTECTMTSSYYPLPADDAARGTALVGRPIDNARIYILDAQRQLVPPGVVGEVYIGGPGLARGYFGRPDLTAERFVADPFAGGERARMYRTGDMARHRADGSIEFLGRVDHQIKVRGIRVEPAEIEAAFSRLPAVRQAVVVAREDGAGSMGLVAYVVPSGPMPSAHELRTALKEHLPEAMIPSAFVALEQIPLTPNGKVDRAALPAPAAPSASASPSSAPRTSVEQRLAEIWAEILGLPAVGIDDNFFDLGGESFKAIRMTHRFGPPLRVIDLFKFPTIRGLAEHLAAGAQPEGALLHELTAPQAQRTLSVVCIPYGGGSAISYQPLAKAMPPGCALYAVALPGHDDASEPPLPLEQVARMLVDEIKRSIQGPVSLYGHCSGSALAVETARLLEVEGVALRAVYIGGAFPNPRLPGKVSDFLARTGVIDRLSSDRTFKLFFRSMGGFSDDLDPEEVRRVVRNLRHDSRDAEEYFTRRLAHADHAPLAAPIVCVVGERDPLTEYYQERFREWELFSGQVRLAVLPRAGHYFIKHRAAELARIVTGGRLSAPPADAAAWQPAPQANRQPRPGIGVFLLVALGQLISLTGSALTGFALSVWVYTQTGSVTLFALLSVCSVLPGLLLAPLSGALIDRVDRRLAMLVSDLAAGVGSLSLAALLWSGQLQLWHVFAFMAWNAVCSSFQRPAYSSAVPQLVPKRYLVQANSVVQMADSAGQMIAPMVAAALVVTVGLPAVILIDVASFIFAVTLMFFIRFPNSMPWRRREPLMVEITRGWRYVTSRFGFMALLIHAAISNLLLAIMGVLITPMVLHGVGGPADVAVVSIAGSAGALIGALFMSLWGGPDKLMRGILGFSVVNGAVIVIMGLQPSTLFVAAGMFLYTLTLALGNSCYTSLIQVKVPHYLHGRVFSINQMIAFSTMPLGFLLAGPLSDRVFEPLMAQGGALAGSLGALIGAGPGRGMALLIIIIGFLTILITLVGYAFRPLWNLESDIPDAQPDEALAHDSLDLPPVGQPLPSQA
ncbi:amino acid adenylation domain-containing protein [Chloroflexia bacterium SDU3-3]|nr:amino acid adenylation domain-containing protein [Chloroflexia bacterium SDU3-3]